MSAAIVLFYPFDTEFMVRALFAAVVLGACAPLVGTFVVQRRLSLVGDGLGHVAAAGVGIALWLDFAPQGVAIVSTLIAAIAIEWIFHASKSSDTALAIIFYSGIAASITFAGRSSKQAQLQQYLFGSLLSVTWRDVAVLASVCALTSLVIIFFSRLLLSISIDESSAKIAGINTHILHVTLMCAVALIVSMSMSITGLLLISAVMVVPVMTARNLAHTFFRAWITASIVGVAGSIIGLSFARFFDLAPGGTIVLTHVGLFIFSGMFVFVNNKNHSRISVHKH